MNDYEFENATAYLKQKSCFNFDDLCLLVKLLRSPRGCPWDREQTHKSIRKNMLEEAYEAAEAIDLEDSGLLREELGDVMLQAVLHAEIAENSGGFNIGDVCTGICQKLIVRHPHVFGNAVVSGTGEVLKNWDSIKQESKGRKTASESMEGISKALPALIRAHKIGQKAAKQNFDFASAEDSLEKVLEEAEELRQVIAEKNAARIEEETGDLLLAVVNTARLAGVDAEEALHRANEKFCLRFKAVEEGAAAKGASLASLNPKEMLELWEQSKRNSMKN